MDIPLTAVAFEVEKNGDILIYWLFINADIDIIYDLGVCFDEKSVKCNAWTLVSGEHLGA